MMKRAMIVFVLMLGLIGGSVLAQDATPEATPEGMSEATPEITPEATADVQPSLSEIFASLPQTRLADGGFVVGATEAPITIIEFADFACPHCQDYRPVIDAVIREYVATGQAKFELRIFPTAGREKTYRVGQLLECAEEQKAGTFWQSYEVMYANANVGSYKVDIGKLLAKRFDLDYDDLIDCANNDATQIDKDIAYGEMLGVGGTPAVLVSEGNEAPHFITAGGRVYNAGGVPFEVLAAVIEDANGGARQTL